MSWYTQQTLREVWREEGDEGRDEGTEFPGAAMQRALPCSLVGLPEVTRYAWVPQRTKMGHAALVIVLSFMLSPHCTRSNSPGISVMSEERGVYYGGSTICVCATMVHDKS